jgi:DtxR family Mn-dependent transcriptional regulator
MPKTLPERQENNAFLKDRHSSVMENYLLSLYILKEEQERPTLTSLAAYLKRLPVGEGLGTSLPTVLGMLRRMTRDGLIQMSPQKEIEFTDKGHKAAAAIARRHRLAERLVVDILGVELPRADQEAHLLEHGITPYLESRIRKAVGDPVTCPFGKPIPGSRYTPPKGKVFPMNQAKPGHTYQISSLPDEDPRLLEFLSQHNLLPGQKVDILEIGDYRDVITFRTDRGEGALGFATASRIYITENNGN